jgi:hypothetical protein
MGFEPILSEEGNVFYDPSKHVQDACLAEVPNCQMFVLIIGGRFGSKYKDQPESIVNQEYREAVSKIIPVFAMVEQQVHAENRVYQKNKENKNLDASKITYPGVDSTKIFDFMEEVQGNAINNALVPFSDYNELESYLKQQWAGMMFNFLTHKSESERVTNMLETLSSISSKIEFLSKQILSSVGKDVEKLNAEMYEIVSLSKLWGYPMIQDFIKDFSPANIIREDTIEKLLEKARVSLDELDRNSLVMGRGNEGGPLYYLSRSDLTILKKDYSKLRDALLDKLSKAGSNPKDFLKALEERGLASQK